MDSGTYWNGRNPNGIKRTRSDRAVPEEDGSGYHDDDRFKWAKWSSDFAVDKTDKQPPAAGGIQSEKEPNKSGIQTSVGPKGSLEKAKDTAQGQVGVSQSCEQVRMSKYCEQAGVSKYCEQAGVSKYCKQAGVSKYCEQFDEHDCNPKSCCTDRHGVGASFLWRLKSNGNWINLKDQSLIEKTFCDPNKESFWDVTSFPGKAVYINFLTMTTNTSDVVQRLSTPSYVKQRGKVDSTRWQWYWYDHRAENPWIPYGQSGQRPFQDVLELKFLHDPSHVCEFEVDLCKYRLNFSSMEQRNTKTNFCRPIRRRPIYPDSTREQIPRIDYHCDLQRLPTGWAPMDTESKSGMELIPLHTDDESYLRVKSRFFATLMETQFKIKTIYRVQNLELWMNFQTKKSNMEKHHGTQMETIAFHGTFTDEAIRWICSVGVDQRMNGANATKFGKGAYFAKASAYSHRFTSPSPTDGLRRMFCARLLVGQTVKGEEEFKRPPPIDPLSPSLGLYDSCVDSVSNPNIYVIFDNNQSYAEFLIEYCDVAN